MAVSNPLRYITAADKHSNHVTDICIGPSLLMCSRPSLNKSNIFKVFELNLVFPPNHSAVP